jgi:hypothetical protein
MDWPAGGCQIPLDEFDAICMSPSDRVRRTCHF